MYSVYSMYVRVWWFEKQDVGVAVTRLPIYYVLYLVFVAGCGLLAPEKHDGHFVFVLSRAGMEAKESQDEWRELNHVPVGVQHYDSCAARVHGVSVILPVKCFVSPARLTASRVVCHADFVVSSRFHLKINKLGGSRTL
jgi:hypothetical protein